MNKLFFINHNFLLLYNIARFGSIFGLINRYNETFLLYTKSLNRTPFWVYWMATASAVHPLCANLTLFLWSIMFLQIFDWVPNYFYGFNDRLNLPLHLVNNQPWVNKNILRQGAFYFSSPTFEQNETSWKD